MDMWKTGRAHPASSNMMKYVGTELNKRRHELVMAGGGSEALEWDSEETKGGARPRGWLRTQANSLEGGPREVMLNVIPQRMDRKERVSGKSESVSVNLGGRRVLKKKTNT